MHSRVRVGLFTTVAIALAVSCTSEVPQQGSDVRPTYHADVQPLLERSCVHCHSAGNLAPFSLTTYAEVRPLGPSIVRATRGGIMPPWKAIPSESCAPALPWKDDESLTEAELEMLERWVESGSPEGEPLATSRTTPPRSTHLQSFDMELAPRAPYALAGDADEYRCFVLDPAITDERYVSAIDLVPGNAEVVHHATVIIDHERTSAERAGPDGSFECLSDIARGQLTEILNWAPGMQALEFPPDLGVKISPNPLFVLLVHYSPKGSASKEDLTKVRIRFTPSRPGYVLETAVLGGFYTPIADGMGLQPGPNDNGATEFRIPVGVREHLESMLVPLPWPGVSLPWLGRARIFNIMGHAHLAATNVSARLRKRDGKTECLLNDHWNFHWQRRYTYDAALDQLPLLEEGDTLEVACTYDNTMENPILRDELVRRREPLADIGAGPTTRDEMCHIATQVVRPND